MAISRPSTVAFAWPYEVAAYQYGKLYLRYRTLDKTTLASALPLEGYVIARRGSGIRESFTVRKLSFGVGVERTFPLHAPTIAKIERVAVGDVRRAKLYYLRDRVGKRARVKEKRY